MKKLEQSKLTAEFKISKNSSVIPSKTRDLEKAVDILKKNGVILFPTDTVYGIGCRFDNPIGQARIRRIKGTNQNFPILVASIEQAHQLAKFSASATNLASRFWPGGLTLIHRAQNEGEKIALRIPDSEVVKSLIEKSGFPIIGTSANFHGQKSPTTYDEIDKKLIEKVDYVIAGECKLKKESTVVDATFNPPKVLREGAVHL